MSTAIKFSTEEINKIQDLRTRGSRLVMELGQLEAELFMLDQQKVHLQDSKQVITNRYLAMQREEQQLVQELNKKYGSGTVDVESGEFIPA